MRYWILSDIHNNLQQFLKLLGIIPTGDHISIVGDVVHKGPAEDQATLVHLVYQLEQSGRVTLLKGNHEDMSGKGKYEDDLSMERVLLDYLKSRPLFIRKDGLLLMHGGFSSSVYAAMEKVAPLLGDGDWEGNAVMDALASQTRKVQKQAAVCLRARFLNRERGKDRLISAGQEDLEAGDYFWATRYEGQYGHVVFGHQPWKGMAMFKHATGIDTGCGDNAFPPTKPLEVGAINAIPTGIGLTALPVEDGGRILWDEAITVGKDDVEVTGETHDRFINLNMDRSVLG